MRRSILTVFTLLALPAVAAGQSFVLGGSAGPTLTDSGYSLAAGAGLSPNAYVDLVLNVERTHLFSRTSSDGRGGFSSFRGGTLTLGTAEVRLAPFGRTRVRPYGLIGLAAGISRPNVNASFRDPVTNGVRAGFAGGGIEVPAGPLSVFAEARMIVGAEGIEGIVAVAPLRAGVAWRF